MGIVSIIGKIVLVLTNIILLLMSLAMIAVGVIVVTGQDIYKSLTSEVEDKLKEALGRLGTQVDTSSLSLSEFLVPVAYVLIAVGIVIGALSLLGCIGACYTIKVVLILYVLITGTLLLVQTIVVILIYTQKSAFDSTIKPYLKETLDSYAGIEGDDSKTLAWNALMNFEKCCGVDGYEDFQGLTNWPAPIRGNKVALKTPVICCKTKTKTYTCATTPDDTNSYWKTGCYDKLFDLITDHSIVLSVSIVLLLAQEAVQRVFDNKSQIACEDTLYCLLDEEGSD